MKKKGLTAKQVEYMKPTEKRQEISARPPSGLYLVVHPTGKKSWSFRYRWAGRTRKLTFDEGYPDLSLAAARAEAEVALKQLNQDGVDPATAKARSLSEPDTFGQVVEGFITRYAKVKNRSWRETERILTKEAAGWVNRNISEIGRSDILRLLDGIIDRDAPYMANRTHAALGRLFSWAIERGILEQSPVAGIRPPGNETSRDRVLEPEELVEVWKASEKMGYPFGPFIQYLLLTAQRRGEVAGMRWDQIDLGAQLWSLPKEAVKAGRAHDVPLSVAAMGLLEELPQFDGPYVFSTTSGKKPISGFSKAKSKVDQQILKSRRESDLQAEEMPRWTVHDLRRTAATHMAAQNVPPHVLAALLNHSPGQTMGISAIYIRHRFLEERREAVEAWGEYLLGLVEAPGVHRVAG